MITFLYQSRDITKPVTQEKTFWDGTRYYHGYYGSGGDFITSPKISQVFGDSAMVLWCIPNSYLFLSQWTETARRHPFRLVELGPGRGTLMDDILRVNRKPQNLFFDSELPFRWFPK